MTLGLGAAGGRCHDGVGAGQASGQRGLQGGGTQFSEAGGERSRVLQRGHGGGEAFQAAGQRWTGPWAGMSFEGQKVWPAGETVLRKGGDPMGALGTCTA